MRSTTPSSTRTTWWSAIIVDSRHGFGQCEASKHDRTASVVISGHAFIQNLRRGHYELGTDTDEHLRIPAVFDELAAVI
jgi:hypothetical protein